MYTVVYTLHTVQIVEFRAVALLSLLPWNVSPLTHAFLLGMRRRMRRRSMRRRRTAKRTRTRLRTRRRTRMRTGTNNYDQGGQCERLGMRPIEEISWRRTKLRRMRGRTRMSWKRVKRRGEGE